MTNPIKDPIFIFMIELEKNELEDFVIETIVKSEQIKTTIIKYAYMLGCDMTQPFINAVNINDVLAAAICLKYGAALNWKSSDGLTIAHICSSNGYDALLRSFILRGLSVNEKTVDGITPLHCALIMNHYDCAIELINNGANIVWSSILDDASDDLDTIRCIECGRYTKCHISIYDCNDCDDSDDNSDDSDESYDVNDVRKENALEFALEKYVPAMNPLIKLMTSKLTKLNKNNIDQIKKCIFKDQIVCVDIILSRFPTYINKIMQNNFTFLSIFINNKKNDMITKYLRMKTTDLEPNIEIPYLHSLASIFDIHNIKYVLEKKPEHIHKLCKHLRTPIDYVLKHFDEKHEQIIIETLNFLIAQGCNLNNRNAQGFRTIETAIQFCNNNIILLLINSGIDINDQILNEKKYFPPISNNDILGFAAQLGYTDKMDLLLKHKTPINLYKSIPTSMILAIKFDRSETVSYLMKNDEIKKICNKNRDVLLDCSINIGSANKKIMIHFTTNEHIDSLKLNKKRITFNNIEKELSSHIDDYENRRDKILLIIQLFLEFLVQCCEFKSKDEVGVIINTWYKLHIFKEFICFNKIKICYF